MSKNLYSLADFKVAVNKADGTVLLLKMEKKPQNKENAQQVKKTYSKQLYLYLVNIETNEEYICFEKETIFLPGVYQQRKRTFSNLINLSTLKVEPNFVVDYVNVFVKQIKNVAQKQDIQIEKLDRFKALLTAENIKSLQQGLAKEIFRTKNTD